MLIEAGTDANARTENGWTALMKTAARSSASPRVITLLLGGAADINARDKEGMNPLIGAAQYNETPKMITFLLEAGAKANAKDVEGKTYLATHRITKT